MPLTAQYRDAYESVPVSSEGRGTGDLQAQISALEARLDGLIRQREYTDSELAEVPASGSDLVSASVTSSLAPAPAPQPSPVSAEGPAPEDFVSRKWGRSALASRAEEFDDFGLDPNFEQRVRPAVEFLYRSYFRTTVEGIDNVPGEGRFHESHRRRACVPGERGTLAR